MIASIARWRLYLTGVALCLSACEKSSEPDQGVPTSPAAQHQDSIPAPEIIERRHSCLITEDEFIALRESGNSPAIVPFEVRLGSISIGSPAASLEGLSQLTDCKIDVECAYQDPNGLIYGSDEESVVSARASRDELSELIALPLGLEWSDTVDTALDRLCDQWPTQWRFLPRAETGANGTTDYLSALSAFSVGETLVAVRLGFRQDRLEWVYVFEPPW